MDAFVQFMQIIIEFMKRDYNFYGLKIEMQVINMDALEKLINAGYDNVPVIYLTNYSYDDALIGVSDDNRLLLLQKQNFCQKNLLKDFNWRKSYENYKWQTTWVYAQWNGIQRHC